MQHDISVQPTAAVRLELAGPIFAKLEDWRRSQSRIPSRCEAVRLLLGLALSAHRSGLRPPKMQKPSTPSRVTTNSTQGFETAPATSPT
jgi:hypothetical protein